MLSTWQLIRQPSKSLLLDSRGCVSVVLCSHLNACHWVVARCRVGMCMPVSGWVLADDWVCVCLCVGGCPGDGRGRASVTAARCRPVASVAPVECRRRLIASAAARRACVCLGAGVGGSDQWSAGRRGEGRAAPPVIHHRSVTPRGAVSHIDLLAVIGKKPAEMLPQSRSSVYIRGWLESF